MPLPLAMMIPFMGIQSAVMMKQAGENWQYGKRRISAMSNEDFNNLTPLKMLNNSNAEVKSMIPSMKQSIIDIRQFQDFIIVEIIELMRRGLETGLGAIFGLTPQQSNEFFGGTKAINQPIDDSGTGTSGTTLMEKSIAEISSWSDNYLKQQHSRLEKYTSSTRLRIKQVYATRFADAPSFDKKKETDKFKAELEQQQDTNKKIDAIIKTPTTKRRAGQSQKLERLKLIQDINKAFKEMVKQKGIHANSTQKNSAHSVTIPGREYLKQRALMQLLQIKLARLLQAYQF